MKQLTLFDLDKTLVRGDTSVIWREYLIDNGFIFQRQYAEGTLDLDEYIAFSLSPIADIPISTLEEMLSDCVQSRVMPRVFPEAKTLINKLTAKHREDVLIISATMTFIVKAVAKDLGIAHAIGVDLAEVNDRLTAKVIGVPSFQAGKVTRLKAWLQQHGKANGYYDKMTFYTDSINDLPLCEFADQVYTVNPCPQLRPIAEARHWGILNWGV